MRYRDLVANEVRRWKQIQRSKKAWEKRKELIERMIARNSARRKRPRDKIGRVIKLNRWGDEIVRVKNKWMLRSEVDGS